MIESHRELSTSLPWGAENVSENPCANSLVFAEKIFKTERVLSGNSFPEDAAVQNSHWHWRG